ncbi:Alpha/beta_hydrolase fold-containing protein [Hexamita inflata]|uniref:Alpha/beta hydrolase fold-containing protein n=1 Tax=Hexamita inflata TaxID=28002 RepID=A0AA86UMA1_9EUKA|nr:Alpha/beta hydrolase fold-containing protein [Hexamita inflata]
MRHKWPKLKKNIPVLVIPAGTTVNINCDPNYFDCVVQQKIADAYLRQSNLYAQTLSTKGKVVVAEHMTHDFISCGDYEWVGKQILEWLDE